MKKNVSIFILLLSTLVSCGPRSGITIDNSDQAVCGVKDPALKDTAKIIPHTESEANGQKLFIANCRQCHAPMDIEPCFGNSLRGIADRLPKTVNYFKIFIQNSDSLKKSDDAYANKLEAENDADYEHKFKSLTDKEINEILEYTKIPIDMN
ncbi:MAG: c-type cytochrome [Bacteroidota bacterium]